jgi:ribonuclease-3
VNFLRKLFGLDQPAAPKAPAPVRSRDRDFDLKGLERILKYQFKDAGLARTAMTHRSYLHASPGRSGESNERMEFLGDSVVGLAVNEFLYNKFPKLREGELTKMKSLLVSRVILSRTAKLMGLGNYILLSEAENGSGGRGRASILADTLEGVIGAVYLDGGLEPARKLTERLLLREVHEILSDANLANYKSMLQEYVQGEFKTHPQYRISSENGPDHEKMFAVEVVVNGKTLGRGHGNNKKEAEQEAARDALLHFEKLVRPDRGGSEEGGSGGRRRRRGGRGRRGGRSGEGRMEDGSSGGESRGRGGRDGGREPREGRDREGREPREHREGREQREGRELGSRESSRDGGEGREGREGRRHRGGRDRRGRGSREPQTARDPREETRDVYPAPREVKPRENEPYEAPEPRVEREEPREPREHSEPRPYDEPRDRGESPDREPSGGSSSERSENGGGSSGQNFSPNRDPWAASRLHNDS